MATRRLTLPSVKSHEGDKRRFAQRVDMVFRLIAKFVTDLSADVYTKDESDSRYLGEIPFFWSNGTEDTIPLVPVPGSDPQVPFFWSDGTEDTIPLVTAV